MRVTSEKKWYKRFRYFAHQHKVAMESHGGANSWKARYVHLVDLVDRKSGRCTLCRQKGHCASRCNDPLPDVLYPSSVEPKSSSPSRSQQRSHGDSGTKSRYEDRSGQGSGERAGRYPHERSHSRGDDRRQYERDDRRQDERRRYDDRGNEQRPAQYRDEYRRRDHSADRGYNSQRRDDYRQRDQSAGRAPSPGRSEREQRYGERSERSPTPDSGHGRQEGAQSTPNSARSQPRQSDLPRDRQRSPSAERRPMICYRCGFEGHAQRDCTATKDRDGRTI